MRLRTAFFISLGVFVGGCVIVYFFHAEVSEFPALAYALVAITAVAAIIAPLFGVALLNRWIASLK